MRGLERLDRSLWTSVMEEMIGQQVVVICKANENLTEEEYEVSSFFLSVAGLVENCSHLWDKEYTFLTFWDFNCSIKFKGDYRQTHSTIMNLAQLNAKLAAAFYAARTAPAISTFHRNYIMELTFQTALLFRIKMVKHQLWSYLRLSNHKALIKETYIILST